MFAVAVATVLFPALSRLAAREDREGFSRTLDVGARQIGFFLIPAGVGAAVLAEPIVRLVYERGAFEPEETPIVAGALAAFSLGLVFNGWMLLLNRAYYSLQTNWVPTLVALGNVGLNVVLYLALYRVGVWGIPLGVSIANVVSASALFVVMRPRLRGVSPRATATTIVRFVVAAAILAVVAFGTWWVLDELVGRALWAQILSVGMALAAGGAAYLVVCRLMRVRELDTLLDLLRRGRVTGT
jgi:putative peptidoglycan lipid II flippase